MWGQGKSIIARTGKVLLHGFPGVHGRRRHFQVYTMRLTDVITSRDVLTWLRHNYNGGITPAQLADTIYKNCTPEIISLAHVLEQACGFENIPETITLLQFLDSAMQHKQGI